MTRHFLQLYILIVLVLAVVSWGQQQLWQTYGRLSEAEASTQNQAQAAVLAVLEEQLRTQPRESRAQFVADIAARTGFADQSHLTRALTADTARTPRRLRSSAPCSEFAREVAHLFSSQELPKREAAAPLYPARLRAAGGLPAPRH